MKGIASKVTLTILLFSTGMSQAEQYFEYHVNDVVRTANLHYSISVSLSIGKTEDGKSAIRYGYGAYLEGVNMPSYEYIAMERCTLLIPEDTAKKILKQFSGLSTAKLSGGESLIRRLSDGYIEIKGNRHNISSRPDTPARQLWTRNIVAIRDKHIPKEKRKSYIRIVEGDRVSPTSATIEQLLQAPDKYDGKRVRVSGYGINNMLYLNLAAYEKTNPTRDNIHTHSEDVEFSIPLSGPSGFANPKEIGTFNGKQVLIEGTFEFRPSPPFENFVHKGTIKRLTLIEEVKKP